LDTRFCRSLTSVDISETVSICNAPQRTRQGDGSAKRAIGMKLSRKIAAIAVIMSAPWLCANQAGAQEAGDRAVEQYKCKDVMRESGSNRDVAIAFLHGYLTGKSGSSKFNVDTIHKQTGAFIERCLDNPNETALNAMLGVK
jgi:hypothetical protein